MTETKTEVSESNQPLQHQASSDPSQGEIFETTAPPTEVPYLKNLLEHRVIDVPSYTHLHLQSMELLGPRFAPLDSGLEDVQLPFMLEYVAQAPILEAELLKALEDIEEGEYLWVYFEDPHTIMQMMRDKPMDASPKSIEWISIYLHYVEREILKFAKRHMDRIYSTRAYTRDISALREFFADYSPSKENWKPYVYIAEHCHRKWTSEYRTEGFVSKFEVRYFMRLFAEGFHIDPILDFHEEKFENGSLSMPEEEWPAFVYERYLMKVKHLLERHIRYGDYEPEYTNAHKRPIKKSRAKVVCFNCNEKGHYARNCPKQKKRRSD